MSSETNETHGPNGEPLLVRMEWVSASQFHPSGQKEVLREVSNRVQALRARSAPGTGHPLVVLDLDSTLYEVAPRTHAIVREWAQSEESKPFTEIRVRLLELAESDMGYSLRDTFRTAGFSLDEPHAFRAWEAAKKFWVQRFFRSAYLKHDRPYPGAARFAVEMHRLGAELIYLTGR